MSVLISLIKENNSIKPDRKSCQEMMKGIYGLMTNEDWNGLDEVLSVVDKESSKYIIGLLLRTTYPVKDYLREWEPLINNSKEWLTNQGVNPNNVLEGLIEENY